jgi:hydrogenase maturation protease
VKKILIGGIGSVLLGDDGVGPHVILLLEANYSFEEPVTVVDLGTPGLDLVAHLSGVDAVILIDSVKNDAKPGTITLYRREDILRASPALARMDPHSPALSESLLIADFTGEGAEEVLLIGITGQQYEVGTSLSAAVRCGAASAVAAVLAELDRLGAHYSNRVAPDTSGAWWDPVAGPLSVV